MPFKTPEAVRKRIVELRGPKGAPKATYAQIRRDPEIARMLQEAGQGQLKDPIIVKALREANLTRGKRGPSSAASAKPPVAQPTQAPTTPTPASPAAPTPPMTQGAGVEEFEPVAGKKQPVRKPVAKDASPGASASAQDDRSGYTCGPYPCPSCKVQIWLRPGETIEKCPDCGGAV